MRERGMNEFMNTRTQVYKRERATTHFWTVLWIEDSGLVNDGQFWTWEDAMDYANWRARPTNDTRGENE
jgi:hypothetical protein